MEKFNENEGVWRTIGGRRVFIRTGQSLSSAMRESGKFKTKSGKVRKEDSSKEVKEENVDKEENKYKSTKREGFGSYNDDYVPVYENKIDYTGDFSRADLSKLSDEELTSALSKQSELYNQATSERIGDQRTRNGKMDKIFNTAKKQQYEKGMTKLNEEMQKRNLPRYNIYNESNGLLMVSSPTKEMAERQLKDMTETDKSLQKEYGWKELPKYSVKEETKGGKEIEKAMFSKKNMTEEEFGKRIKEIQSTPSYKAKMDEAVEELNKKYGYPSKIDKATNETMNEAIRAKASKKSTVFKDDLPKKVEIKEQGNSNRKEVSENIQAHILEYYDSPDDFIRQMDVFDNLPTKWHAGKEIAKGGSYLIYNQDMSDFLDSLKINPKGKKFSDEKAFDMYTSLVGRESEKLYNRLQKNAYNKYTKEHPLSKMTFEEFKKSNK